MAFDPVSLILSQVSGAMQGVSQEIGRKYNQQVSGGASGYGADGDPSKVESQQLAAKPVISTNLLVGGPLNAISGIRYLVARNKFSKDKADAMQSAYARDAYSRIGDAKRKSSYFNLEEIVRKMYNANS